MLLNNNTQCGTKLFKNRICISSDNFKLTQNVKTAKSYINPICGSKAKGNINRTYFRMY